jgi:hypothetical protein
MIQGMRNQPESQGSSIPLRSKASLCTFKKEKGSCRHGDSCEFAHGDVDLHQSTTPAQPPIDQKSQQHKSVVDPTQNSDSKGANQATPSKDLNEKANIAYTSPYHDSNAPTNDGSIVNAQSQSPTDCTTNQVVDSSTNNEADDGCSHLLDQNFYHLQDFNNLNNDAMNYGFNGMQNRFNPMGMGMLNPMMDLGNMSGMMNMPGMINMPGMMGGIGGMPFMGMMPVLSTLGPQNTNFSFPGAFSNGNGMYHGQNSGDDGQDDYGYRHQYRNNDQNGGYKRNHNNSNGQNYHNGNGQNYGNRRGAHRNHNNNFNGKNYNSNGQTHNNNPEGGQHFDTSGQQQVGYQKHNNNGEIGDQQNHQSDMNPIKNHQGYSNDQSGGPHPRNSKRNSGDQTTEAMKTALCKWDLTKSCKFGDDCKFAHGRENLIRPNGKHTFYEKKNKYRANGNSLKQNQKVEPQGEQSRVEGPPQDLFQHLQNDVDFPAMVVDDLGK